MSTITAGAVLPVGGAFATTPAFSGTFIPTLWSSKLNVKFYNASTFADICNHDWEGDIKNLGDKVIIQNIPDIVISDYVAGGNLTYQVPTPSTLELVIDRAKSFQFAVNDVLDHQAKPNLMDMFSNDASEQMRTVMDSTCIFRTYNQGAAANRGATAGRKSGAFNLGTDTAPVVINTSSNIMLQKILELASVLDEQNVPDSGRWLVLDPYSRTLLMQSNLAQAQFMGDDKSMVRNGLIGTIDRFKVYVSNQLPQRAANVNTWVSGDGAESATGGGAYATAKTRAIIAGHTSAISFASQMVKTEQLRNPTDFGDLVRGLQVFGHKVTKPEAMALLVTATA